MSRTREEIESAYLAELTGLFMRNFAQDYNYAGQPRLADEDLAKVGRAMMANVRQAKTFLARLLDEAMPKPVLPPNGEPARKKT